MDKKDDIIEKVKRYRDLVLEIFPMKIEKTYLYGSFAKGTARKDSDIDVVFVVEHFSGNYFEVIPPIWKLTEEVDNRIEPKVVARDDDYAGFIDEVQRTGIELM